MLHLTDSRISFQNLHLTETKKCPRCLSVAVSVLSEGGVYSRKHCLLNGAGSWHMIYSTVRVKTLLTRVTSSIGWHKLFLLNVKSDRLQLLPSGVPGFYHHMHQTILSGRSVTSKHMCPRFFKIMRGGKGRGFSAAYHRGVLTSHPSFPFGCVFRNGVTVLDLVKILKTHYIKPFFPFIVIV